jgi:hypothetical protein
MKIAEIRRIINSANWSRLDLHGATRDEFIKMDVGQRLYRHVVALRALEIAPRFADDIRARDSAAEACLAMIGRWEGLRAISPVTVANHEARTHGPRLVVDNTKSC